MSNLIVTFSQSNRRQLRPAPVSVGAGCRTEILEIGAESEASDLAATADEEFVELYAEAACWVTIGADPTAAEPSTDGATDARYIEEGGRREFSISAGDKIAVIMG